VGGKQHKVVDRRVLKGQLVDMQGKGLGVLDGDDSDPPVQLAVADSARRVSSNLVGEQHILGRHWHPVAPARIGKDRKGDVDPFLTVGQVDRDGVTSFD
jgi:hypothetical protein